MEKIIKKISEARQIIRDTQMKKEGWNEYSKYHFFTPEQISTIVATASQKVGILCLFDLIRNEYGETGYLNVYDIETAEKITFQMATAIPSITATNATQQVGGCMTFTERYLLQSVFDIKDNSLDPDTKDNSKKPTNTPQKDATPQPEKWLNETLKDGTETKEWENVKTAIEQGKITTLADVMKVYKVAKVTQEKITNLLNK
jgi:hypothetical protein